MAALHVGRAASKLEDDAERGNVRSHPIIVVQFFRFLASITLVVDIVLIPIFI